MSTLRWLVSVCGALAAACGGGPLPNVPSGEVGVYPVKYAILDDDALERRTSEAMARVPGWTILLDPFGLLTLAQCGRCTKTSPMDNALTSDDRAQIGAFLSANSILVGLDGPGAAKKSENDRGLFFQQKLPSGVAGFVHVNRIAGVLTISGHMWPGLAAPGTWLPDAALEESLRRLDTTPDLLMEHRFARIQRNDHGPLEIHEAACLYTAVDAVPGGPVAAAARPCVDARTGENLTAFMISWTVKAAGGKVTERVVRRGRR